MKTYSPPKPPRGLSREARRWWARLCASCDLSDDAGQLQLQAGLEALDLVRKCERVIKREGMTVEDRFEQRKPHPLLPVLRDARSQVLLTFRQLNFGVTLDRGGASSPSKDNAFALPSSSSTLVSFKRS